MGLIRKAISFKCTVGCELYGGRTRATGQFSAGLGNYMMLSTVTHYGTVGHGESDITGNVVGVVQY